MSELRQTLSESLDEAEWNWLIPHADRDAVILVSEALDLVEVGMAIAADQTARVQHWIAEQLIIKPSSAQKSLWNQSRDKRFMALIVQPFVLIQEKPPLD